MVWFSTTQELKESRATYYNNKDYLHIIDDEVLRREIFNCYLRSSQTINLLEAHQNRIYQLRNHIELVARNLALQVPALTPDNQLKQLERLTDKERKELEMSEKLLAEQVLKVKDFKQEANSLAGSLKSLRRLG